jgi:hypothetical protein
VIRLGATLGFTIEPGQRWGRLVGIRKDDVPEIERYIVREFRDGDRDWPTGGYRTTSYLFVIPLDTGVEP